MLRYTTAQVTFREVPDELTLCINISNCPCHCHGCHSPELWQNIGNDLTVSALLDLVHNNPGITCVAFMGGDSEPEEVMRLAKELNVWLAAFEPDTYIKIAWYSGREALPKGWENLDFIKLGPYKEEYGGLDNPNTNQKFYQVCTTDGVSYLNDITSKFQNGDSKTSL